MNKKRITRDLKLCLRELRKVREIIDELLHSEFATLLDWSIKRGGKTSFITELLRQSNEELQDVIWNRPNLPTGSIVSSWKPKNE